MRRDTRIVGDPRCEERLPRRVTARDTEATVETATNDKIDRDECADELHGEELGEEWIVGPRTLRTVDSSTHLSAQGRLGPAPWCRAEGRNAGTYEQPILNPRRRSGIGIPFARTDTLEGPPSESRSPASRVGRCRIQDYTQNIKGKGAQLPRITKQGLRRFELGVIQ